MCQSAWPRRRDGVQCSHGASCQGLLSWEAGAWVGLPRCASGPVLGEAVFLLSRRPAEPRWALCGLGTCIVTCQLTHLVLRNPSCPLPPSPSLGCGCLDIFHDDNRPVPPLCPMLQGRGDNEHVLFRPASKGLAVDWGEGV